MCRTTAWGTASTVRSITNSVPVKINKERGGYVTIDVEALESEKNTAVIELFASPATRWVS